MAGIQRSDCKHTSNLMKCVSLACCRDGVVTTMNIVIILLISTEWFYLGYREWVALKIEADPGFAVRGVDLTNLHYAMLLTSQKECVLCTAH